ncbi:MAG: hypothetical protein JWL66_868 [Sphingomonadales bacterium]|nr:hypothetical protein [Sphingomonadales bacterium]
MRAGAFAEAWLLCEQSLRDRPPATRDDHRLPYHLRWVWDGRDYAGKHVLVRCYHGLGDTIQFARFLPLLARRTASLTLEVQPCLVELIRSLVIKDDDFAIEVVAFDHSNPLPPSECDLEITELDFALRAAPNAAQPPYLFASRDVRPADIIGLCYGAGGWDPERSLPQELLAPLCRQKRCITLMPEPTAIGVLNPQGCPFDMDATASLVASTKLVITVDTMIAHLAGAMGRPTWLLLKHAPDWRWTPGSTASHWYPSMRLYHQDRPGAWSAVVARVERDLADLHIGGSERHTSHGA